MAQIGDRQMSYEMQPLGTEGKPLNNGMSYANADTGEAAREWAGRVIGKNGVKAVEIHGQMMVLGWDGWRPVLGDGARTEYEVIQEEADSDEH